MKSLEKNFDLLLTNLQYVGSSLELYTKFRESIPTIETDETCAVFCTLASILHEEGYVWNTDEFYPQLAKARAEYGIIDFTDNWFWIESINTPVGCRTLAHESAHHFDPKVFRGSDVFTSDRSKHEAEVVAESVAFLLMLEFEDIGYSDLSAIYVKNHAKCNGEPEQVLYALKPRIFKTVKEIMRRIRQITY